MLVAREAFDDVIPRFHQVRGVPISPKIYSFTGGVGRTGEIIELASESRRFLIEYGKLIDYVAVSGWVRFTEQFTSAPKLHLKIEGAKVRRGNISQWCGVLLKIQKGKCFYARSGSLVAVVICSRGQNLESRRRLPKV